MGESIVATFREQQALQEQAAQQGLYGLAIVANHQAITARLERGAERILKLFQEGKAEEAVALMATPQWGEPAPVQEEPDHTSTDALDTVALDPYRSIGTAQE